ncbi:amidohydrolase [Flammeovirgaceae bacterium 311]|nr:amidohydrolase [Flammeovirgaceae bacterium 311]
MELIRKFLFIILIVNICWACVPTKHNEGATLTAIKHVAVVDVTNGTLLIDQTILIQEENILSVGPSSTIKIPVKTNIVDAQGKYVIPGLWDMHVHLDMAGEESLPYFIANGVTGVRDMGTDQLDTLKRWRREVEQGQRIGPHIITAGPMLDGPFFVDIFRITVKTEDEARAAVDSLVAQGVDFIKIHQQITREAYFAAADQAQKHGISFVGHKPNVVSTLEVVEAGQKSIEHIIGIPDSSQVSFSYIKEKGAWVTPTLVLIDKLANYHSLVAEQDARMPFVSASLKEAWKKQTEAWGEGVDKTVSMMQEIKPLMLERTIQLHKKGVGLLAGTDLGVPYIFPGSSLHEELELYVKSGMSPLDALRTATINPAKFLKMEETIGSVQEGKIADLVVLDSNPLEDISSIRNIVTVVFKGRVYERNRTGTIKIK